MTWFGASWGAPVCDPEFQQETPTGQACSRCREPIEPWASGVVMGHVMPYLGAHGSYVESPIPAVERRPEHLECFLGPGALHHVGWCSCARRKDPPAPPPPDFSQREVARLAVHLMHRTWVL